MNTDYEEFAAGARQVLGNPKPVEPSVPSVPTLARRHWTARTDEIGLVRIPPRRGMGTDSLFIRVYPDMMVIDNYELSRQSGRRFLTILTDRLKEEFDYVASPTVTITARWRLFEDKWRFYIHVTDKLRTRYDMGGFWALNEPAARKLSKELLQLWIKNGH